MFFGIGVCVVLGLLELPETRCRLRFDTHSDNSVLVSVRYASKHVDSAGIHHG